MVMAMREKDQADFDLETFVDLFDTALTSNNPTVKRAFKNLLLVAAIAQSEETTNGLRQGPLRRLVDDISHLNKRLGNLEAQGAYRSTSVPNTGGAGYPPVSPLIAPTTTIPPGYVGTNTYPSSNPTWTSTLGGGGGSPTWTTPSASTTNISATSVSNSTTASILKKLEEKDES